MQYLQAINIDTDKLLFATSFFKKLRGLYFKPNGSLLILFGCKSIHTLFFRRNIDVAFLSKELVVIKSVRNLSPWKFVFCNKSKIVVERFSDENSKWFKEGFDFKS